MAASKKGDYRYATVVKLVFRSGRSLEMVHA
jgi:hypothetical protein